MKIWTITTDDRDGCQTVVRVTEAAADAAAMAFCRKHWPKDAGPMPDDFTAAYDLIQSGDSGLIWIEEHDISAHPAIAALRRDHADDLLRLDGLLTQKQCQMQAWETRALAAESQLSDQAEAAEAAAYERHMQETEC